MKKILIAALVVGLLLVAYFAQVAYMGFLAQRFFEQSTRTNDFVEFSNVKFERGFFTSKASFDAAMSPQRYPINQLGSEAQAFSELFSVSVEALIKNNVFAKNNLEIKFESPMFALLQEILGGKVKLDKNFFETTASISLFGKVSVSSKLADIDFTEGKNSVKLTGAEAQSKFDSVGKLLKTSVKLGEFSIIDATTPLPFVFGLTKLDFEESYGGGVQISEYVGGAFGSQSRVSIESINAMDVVFLGLSSQSKNELKDGAIVGKSNFAATQIASPMLQMQLDNISGELEMSGISTAFVKAFRSGGLDVLDAGDTLRLFFSQKPKITLKALNFSSKGKKFDSKGELMGDEAGFKLAYEFASEAKPSEIIPLLIFTAPGADELCVQNEGKCSLNFTLESDFVEYKIKLNGESLDFNINELEAEQNLNESDLRLYDERK